MLDELRLLLRGEPERAPITAYFRELGLIDTDDDTDEAGEDDAQPLTRLETISGFSCIIRYSDARGRVSERRISCQRLDAAENGRFLRAFCHERGSLRMFRVDRIIEVVDLHTGEAGGPEFFDRFEIGHTHNGKLMWGLSPVRRSEVLAALNALAFIARCDGRFHPAERDAIERFICSYWLREELAGEPPLSDMLDYADRLKPDAETFFVSLTRCADNPSVARLVRHMIAEVIAADGIISKEEAFWGVKVSEYLNLSVENGSGTSG